MMFGLVYSVAGWLFPRRCAMTAAQKHACFNLTVVVLTVVTVLILIPVSAASVP